MNIILYCQYYRTRDPKRQEEIDACLRGNLNHASIDRAVIFVEPGAPELPPSLATIEVIQQSQRLTYADWLRLIRKEKDSIGLLVNADIELAEGLENLEEAMNTCDTFLALSRYNIKQKSGQSALNDYPQWTQDTWGVRGDAPITDNLLLISNFPLGYPGCDNRIADVMWSHGFTIKNPCYHIRSLHRHQETTRTYNKNHDRLFGGATYVHPNLSPEEGSELEHTIWTRSKEKLAGLLINQQCVDAGTHKLLPTSDNDATQFINAQTFIGLSWSHHCLGSVHAKTLTDNIDSVSPESEDSFFLPMADLLQRGVSLHLHQPYQVAGACLRLPQKSNGDYQLLLRCNFEDFSESAESNPLNVDIHSSGRRNFLSDTMFTTEPLQTLHLKLVSANSQPEWGPRDGCELVLFAHQKDQTTIKSLEVIAEKEAIQMIQADNEIVIEEESVSYAWILRSELSHDLDSMECLASFGRRFRILRTDEGLYFDDRYWPTIGHTKSKHIPWENMSSKELFLWGFCQPILSIRQHRSSRGPRYASEWDYWDEDDSTEEDAFNVHQRLAGPQSLDSTIQIYIGAPWSTYIHLQHNPTLASQAINSRIKSLRDQLANDGLFLHTHTVCQHENWQSHIDLFEQFDIQTLWLPHKIKTQDEYKSIHLKAWHRYPTNARKIERMDGLVIRDPADKPFLASFQSNVTLQDSGSQVNNLYGLKNRHRFHIVFADECDTKITEYSDKPIIDDEAKNSDPGHLNHCQRYNKLLSDSIFSLCPGGAGSNPARFWESMAVGSIPVLLDDKLELPELAEISQGRFQEWHELILIHPGSELESLPERLETISPTEIGTRSQQCREVMALLQGKCCFAGPVERNLPRLQVVNLTEPTAPLITIPQYGPHDRYFWRSQKCAFYDIVIEWYLRGLVCIRFDDNGYFWWGEPGDILLFERDLIINLEDGKKDPPRWPGYVQYNHAFFANQYHLVNDRNHKLTYWGYAPVKLEKTREQIGRRDYSKRSFGSFYAGSIENETQEYFRSKFIGWEDFIDIYACADKLNHRQTNHYTQEEYLDLISRSKYGVCFHGNGPKCYREIEYLALGTPLIITEGIETDYPEPLIEGLHYLRANYKEDIPRIINSTDPKEWQIMSTACWEWFDRNASVDALFKYLINHISKLDAVCHKHKTAYVLTNPDSLAASLAAKSLQIMDPGVKIEACETAPPGALVLNTNDLVGNELPSVGHEHTYKWRYDSNQIASYLSTIINSAHPQHKKLCTLLGVRLRNFKVEINGPNGPIDPYSRLEDGTLRLVSPNESAKLKIDFDWTRRCSIKYPQITHTVWGPASLEQHEIQAIMEYKRQGKTHHANLSDHFNDYYAIHSKLIPANILAHACKLWMYTNCEVTSITGCYTDQNHEHKFNYKATKPMHFSLNQTVELLI
ncbi:MAG: exostosin family protein [Synechococcaceae cyanobacterium ELA739]